MTSYAHAHAHARRTRPACPARAVTPYPRACARFERYKPLAISGLPEQVRRFNGSSAGGSCFRQRVVLGFEGGESGGEGAVRQKDTRVRAEPQAPGTQVQDTRRRALSFGGFRWWVRLYNSPTLLHESEEKGAANKGGHPTQPRIKSHLPKSYGILSAMSTNFW